VSTAVLAVCWCLLSPCGVVGQVDQFKEEITLKDHRLVKEHFDHHTVEKQKDSLKAELQSVKRQMQSSKQVYSRSMDAGACSRVAISGPTLICPPPSHAHARTHTPVLAHFGP
jgi:hypothetical protein